MKSNRDVYDEKYSGGYGTLFPEGHVIRFYEHYLKHRVGIDGSGEEKVLDFGCGNGTHALYFMQKGFEVYGVDVSDTALATAKERCPQHADNFIRIEPGSDLCGLFDPGFFDIIIANQSLYYLPDSQLAATLHSMKTFLVNGGHVFFTMMGTKNYYWSLADKTARDDGLYPVTLSGRLNETTRINFISSEEEMKKTFSMFVSVFVGYYDIFLLEGSSFHYYFIGKKTANVSDGIHG